MLQFAGSVVHVGSNADTSYSDTPIANISVFGMNSVVFVTEVGTQNYSRSRRKSFLNLFDPLFS